MCNFDSFAVSHLPAHPVRPPVPVVSQECEPPLLVEEAGESVQDALLEEALHRGVVVERDAGAAAELENAAESPIKQQSKLKRRWTET